MDREERLIAKKIGALFRKERKRLSMTQNELGHLLGLSQAVLSRMEAGKIVPSLIHWFRFCDLTRTPYDQIWNGGSS